MILFSSKKLRTALANDSLDSWAKTKYLIFIIAMYGMSGPFYWFAPSFGQRQPWPYMFCSIASKVLNIVLIVFGAKKCFQTNKKGDAKDFVGRFSVLYVPLTFQFIPIAFLELIILGIISFTLPVDKNMRREVFMYATLLFPFILTYPFFVLLNQSFERLVEMTKRSENS